MGSACSKRKSDQLIELNEQRQTEHGKHTFNKSKVSHDPHSATHGHFIGQSDYRKEQQKDEQKDFTAFYRKRQESSGRKVLENF